MQDQTYLHTLARLWRQPALADVGLELNPRLSRSAGRCLPSKNIIEFSAASLASPARFRREVICHEAAHAVVWTRHGRKARPHGPEWQALVREAGFKPRASLIRCGHRGQPRPTRRFRHICDVCHFSRTANKGMPRWRCPECRTIGLEGTLRIERVALKR
jgi:SprT protein